MSKLLKNSDDELYVNSQNKLLKHNPFDIDSVVLNRNELIIVTGDTFQLLSYIIPSYANQEVVWDSDDQTVATVSENGLVTAVVSGSCRITATSVEDNTKYDYCDITVADEIPFIVASGGTVTTKGDYRIHAFTTVGEDEFEVINKGDGKLEILVIGGGGGAQRARSGGGGAGGMVFSALTLTSTGVYEVIVGKGGDGASGSIPAENGDDTKFSGDTINIVALGGGGGHYDGGSGGGGSPWGVGGNGLQPASASGGYGNDGGDGNNTTSSNRQGGGGGGAGENGADAASSQGGDGGDGLYEVTISATTYNFAEMFGTNYGEIIDNEAWFAGGGGAGSQYNGASGQGIGGKGGGADCPTSTTANGNAGMVNTGGGGSSDCDAWGNRVSGAGGSGIVILRYKYK